MVFLKSLQDTILKSAYGGAQPNISPSKIESVEIPLPSLTEQKGIVEKLKKLLGKIKEAKKLRTESLEATQNLLPAELHKIFKEGKKKGWAEKIFDEVIEVESKKNSKSLPYVGMEDVESGSGKFLGDKTAREVKSSTSYFNTNHVLYGKLRPYLNKVLLPEFEGHCSTEFLPLKPNTEFLSREWFAVWLKSDEIVRRINATNNGARMPRANMKEVKKFKIPLPPLPEQKKIVAHLNSFSGKVEELKKLQLETAADLNALEKSLLHRAFEGKL